MNNYTSLRPLWATIVFCSLFFLPHKVRAFTRGAPCSAAMNMRPGTGGNFPDVSSQSFPLEVKVLNPDGAEVSTYRAGIVYTVNIDAINAFRGFVLQPRMALQPGKIVGHFRNGHFMEDKSWPNQGVQYQICTGTDRDSLTHLNNKLKHRISVKWAADNEDNPVQFAFSFVQNQSFSWLLLTPESAFLLPENVGKTSSNDSKKAVLVDGIPVLQNSGATDAEEKSGKLINPVSNSGSASGAGPDLAPSSGRGSVSETFIEDGDDAVAQGTEAAENKFETSIELEVKDVTAPAKLTNSKGPSVDKLTQTAPSLFTEGNNAAENTSTAAIPSEQGQSEQTTTVIFLPRTKRTRTSTVATTPTASLSKKRRTTGKSSTTPSPTEPDDEEEEEAQTTEEPAATTRFIAQWPPRPTALIRPAHLPINLDDIGSFDPHGSSGGAIAQDVGEDGFRRPQLILGVQPGQPKECPSNPCKNGGNCTVSEEDNEQICICAAGWAGKNCAEKDHCFLNACKNSAVCINDHEHGTFSCECQVGWSGTLCDRQCPSYLCINGGKCHTDDNSGIYACICAAGWAGKDCSEDFDDCSSSPCLYGGTCHDKFNGYTCSCAKGFTGERCQRPCVDVYKSCPRWKEEDRCESTRKLTKFFDVNCAVTCGACEATNASLNTGDYPPYPPALDAFHWLIGTWISNYTGGYQHFPLNFDEHSGGYTQTLQFLVAEVPMFGTPSINFTSVSVNNNNDLDVQTVNGFLTLKRSPNVNKTAALMSTSNNGMIIIEEGAVLPEKEFMELNGVYNASLPYMKYRVPKYAVRQFSLFGGYLRVRNRFIDYRDKEADYFTYFKKDSGRRLW